jgi:hypothetical protein
MVILNVRLGLSGDASHRNGHHLLALPAANALAAKAFIQNEASVTGGTANLYHEHLLLGLTMLRQERRPCKKKQGAAIRFYL